MQEMVQTRRAEYVAEGVSASAALIRAQTAVFTGQMDVGAVSAREQHATAERAAEQAKTEWEGATAADAFGIAVQALLRHVVGLRQDTMMRAMRELDATATEASRYSSHQLKALLPRLVEELVVFDSALIQRVQHSTKEVEKEKVRLNEHDAVMGSSAPTRRKNIEETIDEFENAVKLARELMESTATEQLRLWTMLKEVATTDVVHVLEVECDSHWKLVDGLMRDVFVQFAHSQTPVVEAVEEKHQIPAPVQAVPTSPLAEVQPPASLVEAPAATVVPAPVPVPGKYKEGDTMYTRINENAFYPCQVIAYVPNENKYSVLYEDGAIYNVSENHLFTEEEYVQILRQMEQLEGDEEKGGSGCVVM
ncbi:Aste57867_4060 [Aphanomyces stellatus]|uniref:Aste57867_4060 protein n=2 Tax=Aphanomyces stellatus TaxID=120398 RepID=A0A485KAX4_9STRA|nr:hypothetical protein As57867_004049 [Aphanomyces stellatus]VFT81194.1 Aste57867_4060 [Aphanomyces stellatus]